MAIYDNVFRFTIDGNAENGLRAILGEYEKLKNATGAANDMGHFAETIKTSSKSAEGAVSALQNEVKDLPADKRLKIEAATSEAKSGIKDVNESVDKLPKSKQVIVRTETTNAKTGVREVKESLENLPNNTKVKVSANTTGANEALKGTQKELAETGSKAKSTGSILGGAFGGTLIANGLSTLGSKLVEVTKNGLELAEQGEQTERVWENLGAGSKGAAEMSAQMVDLRAKTGYAAGDIKKMQQQFYGLTGSVDSAKNLTEALVGVGVASGLSGDKVGKLVRSMGRLFSSDSVTSSQLARIETQAPKMGSALAAAAGMSQDAFNKMVSDGKLTGSAFEDLVEKVSKQSPAAFSVFGKTGQGAIAQIKGSWISAQSVFGQKLVDTQKTGLTDVANFMKSKDFQGLLGDAAEGLGKIADKIVDVLRYVEKNKGSISEIAKATGSIITDLAKGAWDLVTDFLHTVTGTKTGGIKGVAEAMRKIAEHHSEIETVGKVLIALFAASKVNSLYKDLAGLAGISGSKGIIGDLIKLGASDVFTKAGALKGLKNLGTSAGNLTKGVGKVTATVAIAYDAVTDIADLKKAFSKGGKMSDKFTSVGESAGTLIGGGIGAFFGPGGVAIGATIGKAAGKWAGQASKEFTDGWNKAGRGAKPPEGLIPKAGYYARKAGDAVVEYTKNMGKAVKKYGPTVLKAFTGIFGGVATWFLTDTKAGKAATKWAQGFVQDVKKKGLTKTISDDYDKLSKSVATTYNKMAKNTTNWFNDHEKATKKWASSHAKDWSKDWNGFKDSMGDKLNDMKDGASNWGSNVEKWRSKWSSSFGKSWSSHWNSVKNWMGDSLDSARDHAGSWGTSLNKWWGSFSTGFGKGWRSMWSGLGDFFSSIWDGIKDTAKSAMNVLIGIINGGIGGIDTVIHFFGGKKETIKKIPKLATGTGYHSGGLAMVNDQPGPLYKELLEDTSTGQLGMAEGRNTVLDLKPGTKVYTAAQTQAIMSMAGMPHYAGGTDGEGFFDKFIDTASGFIKGAAEKIKQIAEYVAHPVQAVEKLFDSKTSFPGTGIGSMFQDGSHYMIKQGESWFKGLFSALKDGLDFGSARGNYNPEMIEKAARAMKVDPSASFIKMLQATIQSESGGRNVVQQIHDVNSGGNEARGILQYTPGTFRAFAVPGHTNIMNPYDQLLAFFNNSDWRNSIGRTTIWGVNKIDWLHSGPQGHRRMANGGKLTHPEVVLAGEDGDEWVVNPSKPNAMHLVAGLMADIQAKQPHATLAAPASSTGATFRPAPVVQSDSAAGGSSLLGMVSKLVTATQALLDKDTDIYLDRQKVTKEVNKQSKADVNVLTAQGG
ncbi:hypothetical protein FC50_GL000957 [Lacticaseibacillus pantheris DSM 15945 = JCM 12539 = NBRC 106106]|uniref:Tape measure protein N-terminal domain-containing protein n=2 Tax=Lacticaseibacillus pantheris TaxID=171523 RepID=A0A0R1U552_9LACO|nr:tape measure protein [Lacticaseibacillus pantheris]KRL86435.1 hypothetical protein FC50_GL000957 [Lacticaseibacillus pantheris DSM 15945 = JCM 12539 = NBRC 106106]